MKKCNNLNCSLRGECQLAKLKTKESETFKQVQGDCSNFVPIKKK